MVRDATVIKRVTYSSYEIKLMKHLREYESNINKLEARHDPSLLSGVVLASWNGAIDGIDTSLGPENERSASVQEGDTLSRRSILDDGWCG